MCKKAKYILALIFVSCACDAAQDSNPYLRAVNVIDEDGIGVESIVRRILDDDTDVFIGETDESGLLIVKPPLPCVEAKRLRIKLKDTLQFESPNYQNCKSTVVFRVRRRHDIGYVRDINGRLVHDRMDKCVRTSHWTSALALPECGDQK